jgi:hypothetical protein
MIKRTALLLSFLVLVILQFKSKHTFRRPIAAAESVQVVGIALTANHATASRRYSNGTFDDLGRVEASKEYIELIEALTSWGSEHPRYVQADLSLQSNRCHTSMLTAPSPPYHSMEDMWDDWPRQLLRSARKKIGLPASSDVATVARLLTPILKLVAETDASPMSALISFPAFRGLYQEDLDDVTTYLGLRKIRAGYERHPHELVAAFAGNGLGLNTTDNNETFPVRPTLLIEYTERALLLHHSWMDKAIELPAPHMQLQMSFDKGSNHDPSEQDLTEFILSFLYDEYVKALPPPVPKKVTMLITGSAQSLADGRVERAARTAVGALGSTIEMFAGNPEYMAARGAAELVRHSTTRGTFDDNQ